MSNQTQMWQEIGLFELPVSTNMRTLRAKNLQDIVPALERLFWEIYDTFNLSYYGTVYALVEVGSNKQLFLYERGVSGMFNLNSWALIEQSD